ncbi:MAG: RNA-guided pseudouridylation complex pseudouridine synthase subunit Cbf5 [Candidatus Aenigmatarchaeota archaeon]|nr:MAG: RNA-guided pseudouridylation complex pseudouridine synthase subunit Cbf5 [Candidatus Aenigmarchaeota archaeon]
MMNKDWLVRSEEISDMRFGCYPGARTVENHIKNGIVVIDKPPGPTSHQVTAWVRDMLGLKRAGHAGTLDPKVTGVLVTALENATKIMPALMGAQKEYVAVMKVHRDVTDAELADVVKKFLGKIRQTPPRKSAVKRVERTREVQELEILERDGNDVLMRVSCEAGTYIRKLISDMGVLIGGAHMAELRRVRSGFFGESALVRMQDLKDAYDVWKETGNEDEIRKLVMPVEEGVEHLKHVIVKDTAIDALCNGAPLSSGGVLRLEKDVRAGDLVALLSAKGELVAIGKAAAGAEAIHKERVMAVRTDRVVMARGVYPRTWKV